jgi:hypothetical protein
MNAIQMPEEINQLRRRLVSTAAMGIADQYDLKDTS